MDNKIETRGRKALPPGQHKAPQQTVKVNEAILPFVKELKGNLKKGLVTKDLISNLFNTLYGNSEQQASVFKDPDAVAIVEGLQAKVCKLEIDIIAKKEKITGLLQSLQQKTVAPITSTERGKLKRQYQDEHNKVINLEKVVRNLKSSVDNLKRDKQGLIHQAHDCMALKVDGTRCSKSSKVDAPFHGMMIHVCLQHQKTLAKKQTI